MLVRPHLTSIGHYPTYGLSLSLFTGKKDTMAMRILHPTSCLPRHYDQSRLEFKAHSITQFEFLWNTFANLSFVTSCAHGDECHYSSSPCPFVCQCTMDLPNQTPWYGNHPSNRLQTPPFANIDGTNHPIGPCFNSVKTVVSSCQVNPVSTDSTVPQNVTFRLIYLLIILNMRH